MTVRLVHCLECGRNQRHAAHGLCKKCYAYDRYRLKKKGRLQTSREWYQKNREHHLGMCRQWRQENPGSMRAASQRYRARKAGLPATLTEIQWQEILVEHGHACAYCGRDDLPLEQEHMIPVTRGGGYTQDNIVPACGTCNSRKGTKTAGEFAAWLASNN